VCDRSIRDVAMEGHVPLHGTMLQYVPRCVEWRLARERMMNQKVVGPMLRTACLLGHVGMESASGGG
jgi:hypothetical protein